MLVLVTRMNGPQDARPGKIALHTPKAQPSKQRRDRDVRNTAHNPNEPGRIRILLPVVWKGSRREASARFVLQSEVGTSMQHTHA